MTLLSLQLLGPFSGQIAEEPLNRLSTDKVRALLAFLAIEADQPHRRDRLAALLWPDSTRPVALRNLRKSLHRLRVDLDKQAPLTSSRLLNVERQTIELHSAALWLDVTQFLEEIDASERHPHPTLAGCEPCLERLQAAAALYRGDLLAGLSLPDAPEWEEWQLLWRERLNQQALQLLDLLTDLYLARQDFSRAMDFVHRQWRLDPWRERSYRQGMMALAGRGERSAAIELFERCRELLAEALGVVPDVETIALVEQLRRSDGGGIAGETGPRPPLRLHHFPTTMSPFIGRAAELAEAVSKLRDPSCRLLTLHGSGGIGKSRLSLQVASWLATESDRFVEGIFFVPLANAASREDFLKELVHHLGLEPSKAQRATVQLADFFRRNRLLVVLDNFEQLIDDCAELLYEWIRAAPHVAFLVTSREPLRAQSEWALPLVGLSLPTEGDELAGRSDAVQLFLQALRRVRTDVALSDEEIAAIVRICHLVDGMPLALEQAARWARSYDLTTIAAEIAQDLDFLVSNATDLPARHRNMRVIFEQSWQRLPAAERPIFATLSLFRGGFTAEAARAVSGASLLQLASLLDNSLIARASAHRYQMHELLRQFAAEKLMALGATGQQALARHAAFYRTLLTNRADKLYGANPRAEIERLQRDLDNIRQAWDWTSEHGTVEAISSSVEGLTRLFWLTGQLREAVGRLAALSRRIEQQGGGTSPPLARDTLTILKVHQANFHFELDENEQADRCVTQAEMLGGQARPIVRGQIHLMRAKISFRANAYDHAQTEYISALQYLEGREPVSVVELLHGLGVLHMSQGDLDSARQLFERGLAVAEQANYLAGVAQHQRLIGSIKRQQGERDAALRAYQRALIASRQSGDRAMYVRVLNSLAITLMEAEQFDDALARYQSALDLCREIGWGSVSVMLIGNIGELHARRQHWDEALSALEEACRLAQQLARPDIYANYRNSIAEIHHQMGKLSRARHGYEQALKATEHAEHHRNRMNALAGLGDVHKESGEVDKALGFYQRAIALQRASNHRHHLCRTLIACAEAWRLAGELQQSEPLLNEAHQLAAEFGWDDLAARIVQLRTQWERGAE